jgi:hypothetical protein
MGRGEDASPWSGFKYVFLNLTLQVATPTRYVHTISTRRVENHHSFEPCSIPGGRGGTNSSRRSLGHAEADVTIIADGDCFKQSQP